jgi:hypothetical protein
MQWRPSIWYTFTALDPHDLGSAEQDTAPNNNAPPFIQVFHQSFVVFLAISSGRGRIRANSIGVSVYDCSVYNGMRVADILCS